MSQNYQPDGSNLSNRYSNEIQIRSNLQIKDLSKNNSIFQGNPTVEKVKTYQKIQKIKINYDNIKPREEILQSNKNTNNGSNKAYFKSTIDEVFSSEQKDNQTKDPSFRSNIDRIEEDKNNFIKKNDIIVEKKYPDYDEKMKKFKIIDNKLVNNKFDNPPVLMVNDIQSQYVQEKNLENTKESNKLKNSNLNKISNKKIIMEKT